MLVLSRRPEEAIHVDGPCEVRVLGWENGKVKLGFTAPESTRVVRSELIKRDEEERNQAA